MRKLGAAIAVTSIRDALRLAAPLFMITSALLIAFALGRNTPPGSFPDWGFIVPVILAAGGMGFAVDRTEARITRKMALAFYEMIASDHHAEITVTHNWRPSPEDLEILAKRVEEKARAHG